MAQNVFVQQLTVDANNNYNSFNINHLNLILMYEVIRQVINSVGNVQSRSFVAFVSINSKLEFDAVVRSLHGRAKADTLTYSVRGREERVKFILRLVNIIKGDAFVEDGKRIINGTVDSINNYIDWVNTAAKKSAKINSRKDSHLLKHVNVDGYWLDKDYEYAKQSLPDNWDIY